MLLPCFRNILQYFDSKKAEFSNEKGELSREPVISSIMLLEKNVCGANRLLLVKCYDNKKVKSPYNWVISPLTQPQVANQQKSK